MARMQLPLAPVSANQEDWVWQQSHAVRDLTGLKLHFGLLDPATCDRITANTRRVRMQLTPYMISLIRRNQPGVPDPEDPIWKLYVPTYEPPAEHVPLATALADNWELPEDMVNPVLQHKYDNRVNFRVQNRCLAYCGYCFETKRVLDRASEVGSWNESYFKEAIEYVRARPSVQEVVLSGGEPLTLSNERLHQVMKSVREIPHVRALRLQTRAFAQNPYRIDDGFAKLLVEHRVSAVGVHITHPVEVTDQFRAALDRITAAGSRTLLLGQIPLLRGINDCKEILEELFLSLYTQGVKPFYLLHAMPETLGAERFRTPVRKGVEIMQKLRRRFSNPGLPEYVIVHAKGKHTVPLETAGTPEFQYLPNHRIKFLNWKGEWCEYLDAPEAS